MRKLTSFADKCPLLLSISTGLYKGIDGVFIKVSGSEHKYFFKFDIEADQKAFIHSIKEKLLPEYPRLVEQLYENRQATSLDIAKQLEQGIPLNNVQKVIKTYLGYRVWRIEKVFSWNKLFFLYPERVVDESGNEVTDYDKLQYRYEYNGSSILFLKKYRTKEFKDEIEAASEFFRNANLINTVNVKNE